MKTYLFIGITFLLFSLNSCMLSSKFTQSADYQSNKKISDLHLVVIGDSETKAAMDYLGQFMTDSLTRNNVKTTNVYHCCRDKNTDLNSLIPKLLPTDYKPDFILAVVISKVIIGYGTTSSREIQLDLFDTSTQKHTWTGSVTVNMSWFISDQDYRNVAGSLTKTILAELKKKNIM